MTNYSNKLLPKLLGFTLTVVNIIGCTAGSSQESAASSTNLTNIQAPNIPVREKESVVHQKNITNWNAKSTQIVRDADIKSLYFYNETVGYAITSTGSLYKTSNSGEAWVKISSIKNITPNDIFFISPSEGFIIAYKQTSQSVIGNYESFILKTEDGGKNWNTIYSLKSALLEKMTFNSDGRGLAVGLNQELHQSNFVLLTNDRGQNWTDISGKLNEIAVKKSGRVEDYLTDVTYSEHKGIVTLSLRGKIYNTTDEGKTWNLLSSLIDEPSQTNINHIGSLDDGILWIAGGTISVEGKWGVIAITSDYLNWDKYRLNGYYFSDAKFLFRNEVIACGSIVAPNNFSIKNDLDKGVILYSSDSGKNWMIVHKSQMSNKLTSVSKLSENKLFVAGKNGIGILVERNQ